MNGLRRVTGKFAGALFFLMFLSPTARAGYEWMDPPQLSAFGTTEAVGGLTLTVKSRTGDFSDDQLVLVIGTRENPKKIVFPFESAYERFHLYALPLTSDSMADIVLVTAQGRGSGVTQFYLDIYQVSHDKLLKKFEKLVATHYGPELSGFWWYSIDFDLLRSSDSAHPDIQLDLHDQWDGPDTRPGNSEGLPQSKQVKVYWDFLNSAFVEKAD